MKRKKTLVIGLTGSIGSGKSTATKVFAALGLPTLSADAIVHELLARGGGAEKALRQQFPSAFDSKGLSRARLFEAVFPDPDKIKKLENIIHPLVYRRCKSFIAQMKKEGAAGLVIEIPLLFESGFEALCDVTVCLTVAPALQKERVLKRRGMTQAKLRALRKRQWTDRKKTALADYVIKTDAGLSDTRHQIKKLWGMINPQNTK